MNLSLGCGHVLQGRGWLHHDRTLRPGVQLAFDLAVFPWPVASLRGKVQHILAEDVLEHIPAHLTLAAMDECWGLLTPTGTMAIRVPVFGTHNHLADITHCRGFSIETFDLLDPDTITGRHNPWYTTRRWKIQARRQDEPGKGHNLHFTLQKRPSPIPVAKSGTSSRAPDQPLELGRSQNRPASNDRSEISPGAPSTP